MRNDCPYSNACAYGYDMLAKVLKNYKKQVATRNLQASLKSIQEALSETCPKIAGATVPCEDNQADNDLLAGVSELVLAINRLDMFLDVARKGVMLAKTADSDSGVQWGAIAGQAQAIARRIGLPCGE